MNEELFGDEHLPEEEFLKTEQELRREIGRLNRLARKTEKWHEQEVASLRAQIRDLLTKNMELSETCNLFAKGLDRLKQDTVIVTIAHHWTRRGAKGLKERIAEFALDGKRIVSICPTNISPQGDTMEAVIVTEHTDRLKKPIL